jgi:hypothetical protein
MSHRHLRTTALLTLVLGPALSAQADTRDGDVWAGPCDVSHDDADKRAFVVFDRELRAALTKRDAVAMAFLASFPLHVNESDGTSISLENAATLEARFTEIFPDTTMTAILGDKTAGPSCMHDGIMYASGAVWVTLVGAGEGQRFRVTTVNLPPRHAPTAGHIDFVCDASKHRVVVDSVEGGKPRYRAWNKPRSTLETPDMEIKDGVLDVQGTHPCTHSIWTFRKGRAEFGVEEPGCSESTPPEGARGALSVSVAGKAKQHWWCY